MIKYSIQHIARVLSADFIMPDDETSISYLLTDSRSLFDAGESLFFALKTAHNDGHKYIRTLYERGVRNFVVQEVPLDIKYMTDANFLIVEDPQVSLQQLAIYHRHCFDFPVIGITGSNGKTIIKEWLYQLLSKDFNIVRSPRSYNSQIGVPLSIWQIDEETELGIFEAGISEKGEMMRLQPIIDPVIGIITNIGDAHQENFSSKEEKCMEKLILFRKSKCLIYNEDDILIKECVLTSFPDKELFGWSRKNEEARLYISEIEVLQDKTTIAYKFDKSRDEISIPFIDEASIENAIHCLASILYLDKTKDLEERFEILEPVAMRLEVKRGINNCILINDSYNSDINSLEIALNFMAQRSAGRELRTILILSDVLQSGIPSDIFYRKLTDLIEKKGVRQLVGIGPDLYAHANLFETEKEFFLSTEDFLHSGFYRNFEDAIILIKGSRYFQFEKISEQLEERVHETRLEVDLDAFIHNFKYFRSKLLPATKIITMVKAFGYGVGSYELAKTLQDQGGDYLAVAVADEGAELRREGISTSIIVMNPEMTTFNTLFDYNLEPEIYNFRLLDAMISEAKRRGITNYPVHVKVDTGMHRLGFELDDVDVVAAKFRSQRELKIRSVFTHLAGSDSPELDDYTRFQMENYNIFADVLEQKLDYHFMRHGLNSAGIERFPEYQYDMVRLGIGLYGISAIKGHDLKYVATLKTNILQIKNVKKGETVGYGRRGVMTRDSRIACLPIGYADGLDRKLSNLKGRVFINGTLCPIVGNICMDLCMIDVTDVQAKEGDTVIIFGKEITIQEIATELETIPYEILTSISPRVKRIYFRE